MAEPRPEECQAGDAALARGAWEEARGRLYRDRGDRAGAARLAVWIAWDTWAFRGEHAVASGWLQRARTLLDGLGDVPERACWSCAKGRSLCWTMAIRIARTATPRKGSGWAARRRRSISRCLAARCRGWRWSPRAVAEGMRTLDEVNTAVVAGEMTDLIAIGLACCYIAGDPGKAAPYTIRLKSPAHYAIPAHSHPTDEHVVVVAGALTFGMGDKLTKGADNKTIFALLPTARVHAVAAQLSRLSLFLAVLAAVFPVRSAFFDQTTAGGVGALDGFRHREPPRDARPEHVNGCAGLGTRAHSTPD